MFEATLIDRPRSLAGMILGMAVGQAEVEATLGAEQRHQLLLLAPGLVALVGEHFLARLRLTVPIYVSPNSDIRQRASWRGYWGTAQGAHRHLNILLILGGAAVVIVEQVIFTEQLATGVALHGQVVQLFAGLLAAVLTHMRELHPVFLLTYCWLDEDSVQLGGMRGLNNIL